MVRAYSTLTFYITFGSIYASLSSIIKTESKNIITGDEQLYSTYVSLPSFYFTYLYISSF